MNAETPIEQVLGASFPWCSGWTDELKELFAGYVEAKPGAITVNDDPDEYKIPKLRAEILELGSVIRQLRRAGMDDAATQLLLRGRGRISNP